MKIVVITASDMGGNENSDIFFVEQYDKNEYFVSCSGMSKNNNDDDYDDDDDDDEEHLIPNSMRHEIDDRNNVKNRSRRAAKKPRTSLPENDNNDDNTAGAKIRVRTNTVVTRKNSKIISGDEDDATVSFDSSPMVLPVRGISSSMSEADEKNSGGFKSYIPYGVQHDEGKRTDKDNIIATISPPSEVTRRHPRTLSPVLTSLASIPTTEYAKSSTTQNDGRGIMVHSKKYTFREKLYDLMMDAASSGDNTASWSDDGKSFTVHDHARFASNYLPTYFGHNNMRSLDRQLHYWSFETVSAKGVNNRCFGGKRWQHPFFQKDRRDLLQYIERKKRRKNRPQQQQQQQQQQQRVSALQELQSDERISYSCSGDDEEYDDEDDIII